jgi:hypothetical protein
LRWRLAAAKADSALLLELPLLSPPSSHALAPPVEDAAVTRHWFAGSIGLNEEKKLVRIRTSLLSIIATNND